MTSDQDFFGIKYYDIMRHIRTEIDRRLNSKNYKVPIDFHVCVVAVSSYVKDKEGKARIEEMFIEELHKQEIQTGIVYPEEEE